MPKKWKEDLAAELVGKDKKEQQQILDQAQEELDAAAREVGVVAVRGRKVG